MSDETIDIDINLKGSGGLKDTGKDLENVGDKAEKSDKKVGSLRKNIRALGETSKVSGQALGGMGGALGSVGEAGQIAYAAMELMEGGLQSLADTLLENPIFLLAAVIAAIVVVMIDMNKEIKAAEKAFEDAKKAVEKYNESLEGTKEKAAAAHDEMLFATKQISETELKLRNERRESEGELTKQQKGQTEALGKLLEANKDLFEQYVKSLANPLADSKKLLKELEESSKAVSDFKKKLVSDDLVLTQEASDKKVAIEAEEADKKKKKDDEEAKKKKKAGEEAYKKSLENTKKLNAETLKLAQDQAKTYEQLENEKLKGEREVSESTLNEFDKRKAKANDTYSDELKKLDELLASKKIDESDYNEFVASAAKKRNGDIANADKDAYAKSFTEKEKALKEEGIAAAEAAGTNVMKKLEIEADYLNQEHDLAVQAAIAKGEDTDAIDKTYQAKLVKNAEETAKEKKKLDKEEADNKLNIATQTVDSISSLEDVVSSIKDANLKKGSAAALAAAKKEFKIKKALSITSAVISGVQGVVNALSAQSVVPEPFGTVLKVATAVGVGVATAANVAKIASTQFNEGATGGGGGASGASAPSAPSGNFSPASLQKIGGATPPNMMGAGSGSGVNKPPAQKVYVVSGQMTDAQAKDSVLERRATFGGK